MLKKMRFTLALSIVVTATAFTLGQDTRLNLFDPAVVISTGGRTAACDSLTFTPDGQQLLAVGDDKCIHIWDVVGNELNYTRPAWWNSFRERRGSMFALAVSPDGKKMASGGFGRLTSDFVIFDRESRKILHALSPAIQPAYIRATSTIWATAFDPKLPRVGIGQGDGSIWVWDYEDRGPHAVRRVAPPVAQGNDEQTIAARVSWLSFALPGEVCFARRSGEVFAAPVDASAPPRLLFRFSGTVAQALSTPDQKTLVGRSGNQRFVTNPDGSRKIASGVEVRSFPEGRLIGELSFPATEFPDGMGLDPSGKRFGLGIKLLDTIGGEKVFREGPGYLRVYELTNANPRLIAETGFGTKPDDPIGSFPEAVAFHPDGRRLAVAAGIHHETSLWEIGDGQLRLLHTTTGVGRTLWQVQATEDGSRVSFRSTPLNRPTDPNARGQGPWRTFDLHKRQWVRGSEPQGHGPLTSANGWTIETDPTDQFRWAVVSRDQKYRYVLPLDSLRDFTPICYTFLPPQPGSPVTRVAVGHYWGYSLFEFAPDVPARRIRRGVGHHGYVTSIVPAANGRWLVSASRDETICIWSTEPWQNQPELGASFDPSGVGESIVKAVDAGSPAWEIGLIPGDRIRKVYRAAKVVDPFDWNDVLTAPTPGEELALEIWRFADQKRPIRRKTSLLQRPVWRFLPTGGADWVLYRYQDYVYDSSTNGDSYFGWLLGGPLASNTPEFNPASRFRSQFRRPSEVRDFLTRYSREPSPFFRELLPPPAVTVTASAKVVPANGVTLNITVSPPLNAQGKPIAVDKVELWLGDETNLDYLLREWPGKPDVQQIQDVIRPEELRIGQNRLVVVAYSHARAEQSVRVTVNPTQTRPGVLRAVVVGVDQYAQIGLPNLGASVSDAKLMANILRDIGKSAPFERGEITVLTDQQATPPAILAALDQAGKAAAPDDWFVLFLAGHGFAHREKPSASGNAEFVPGTWYFAGYGPKKQARYQVEAEEFFNRLKRLPCRKLILLDSCHSGAAIGVDGGRELRPDDKGPIVLTAAAPHEQAGEDVTVLTLKDQQIRARHGFFTAAVFKGLGPKVGAADRNGDTLLTIDELFEFARAEVNRLRPDQGQTVTMAPFPLRNVGLIRLESPQDASTDRPRDR